MTENKSNSAKGKPLKIAIVLGHAVPFPSVKGGGIETINLALAREFARLGHHVTCYSRNYENLPRRERDAHNIEHIRFGGANRSPSMLKDVFDEALYCAGLLAVFRPCDVAMLNLRWAFLLSAFLPARVVTYTIQRTPKKILKLFRFMRRLYCPSRAVEVSALEVEPRLANLKVIYNCVEIGPRPAAPDRPAGGALSFLYVGRFVPDKGLESLIKGFEKFLATHPGNRLLTVGPQTGSEGADEGFFKKMKAYVSERKLEGPIEFLPPIYDKSRLFKLMQDVDVICVPTLHGETFSSAILEAMSIAKPVLVSDFGPMPEAVDDRSTGVVCVADSAESICEGMAFLSANSSRLAEMGMRGWEKANAEFSAGTIAAEFVADFRTLLERR